MILPSGEVLWHWTARATEAAIALLAFVLLTLEVRSVFRQDAMMAPDARFMERAFYVLVWGAFALAALWLARTRRDAVALWAWRVSGALAVARVLIVQVLVANPIFDTADVGRLPVANGLFLAYALSAAMAAYEKRTGRDPSGYFAIGDETVILDRIAEYVAVGVEKFILRPVGPDGDAIIAQTGKLIDKVLPQIEARWPKKAKAA